MTLNVQNAIKCIYNTSNFNEFLDAAVSEVLRLVISEFPYDSNDTSEITLKKDTMIVGRVLKEMANIKLE